MEINCPKCQTNIYSKDINDEEDICFCKNCNETFFISEILNQDEYIEAGRMLLNPPKGTWINKSYEKLIIGTSTHSKNIFILFPFCLIFSGFSFAGFFATLILDDINIIFTLFWSVFVILSCIVIYKTIFTFFGKIEIIFCKNMQIFIGVGKIGKRIQIDWNSVRKIKKCKSKYDAGETGIMIIDEIIIEENNIVKIPIDNINDLKGRFLYLLLKYYRYKKIEDILK